MKKEIIITFNIYQDELDDQNPELTVYVEDIPQNPNKCSVEELNKSGLKKTIRLIEDRKEMSEHLGRTYTYRITEKQLKQLLKD